MKPFLFLPILIAAAPVASFGAPAPVVANPPMGAPPKAQMPAKAGVPLKKPGKVVVPPKAGAPGHEHDHAPAASDKAKDPIGASLDFLWEQSDAAFHKGDYPTAVKIHRAIVTLDPTDTESFGVGAWLLWSMGQKNEAHAFITQGLGANPKDPEMWNVAGEQYDLEKSFSAAKDAYLKSVELSGGKAPELMRRRLAHAAEHAGDLALSEQTWTKLVQDFPASPVNKNNLARVRGLRTKSDI